ncbi:MAG: M1 family metallopeptidase [Deltaproteobacteria bacterium]
MVTLDPHAYADAAEPNTRHIDLELDIDFGAHTITGTARLELDRPAEGALTLDTRDLAIQSVTDGAGQPLEYELGARDPIRGARLRVNTTGDVVVIRYQTSPDASALQWLEPAMTAGGDAPYVFTQCQAIHARSVLPCQDTPRVRSTYHTKIHVPRNLVAVMAAASLRRVEEDATPDRATHEFEMPQPIPSYLFAFAAGNIASRDLGERTRVYAEPEVLDEAAWEFEGVGSMLERAEALFGAYPWDRFDLLVMPPSFPYGGMENPRLTFLTPTLLAKDRSLVGVVAHELAHSWTGNLVTNASMNDFWLNEGFTVYAERRIIEALEGVEARAMHAALGREALERDVARLTKKDPKLTRLENDLQGVDPDEVYSLVPYEKGFLLLVALEEAVGREAFDAFLLKYIERFSFSSITTPDFEAFVKEALPEGVAKVDLDRWIHGSGIPDDAPVAKSEKLDGIRALATAYAEGTRPDEATLRAFDANGWQVFLSQLPKTMAVEELTWLDATFSLAASNNYEIRVGFLEIAARSGYAPALDAAAQTLKTVGRMKYLRPLYVALVEQGADGKQVAQATFAAAKDGYHPVAKGVVAGVLAS